MSNDRYNDPYNDTVRRHFSEPRHAGILEDAVQAFYDDQGLKIRISASIRGNVLEKLVFLAWGCPHVIAALEQFCDAFEGRETEDLAEFDVTEIIRQLDVPVEKTGRMLVIEDTVHSLRAAIRNRGL